MLHNMAGCACIIYFFLLFPFVSSLSLSLMCQWDNTTWQATEYRVPTNICGLLFCRSPWYFLYFLFFFIFFFGGSFSEEEGKKKRKEKGRVWICVDCWEVFVIVMCFCSCTVVLRLQVPCSNPSSSPSGFNYVFPRHFVHMTTLETFRPFPVLMIIILFLHH